MSIEYLNKPYRKTAPEENLEADELTQSWKVKSVG